MVNIKKKRCVYLLAACVLLFAQPAYAQPMSTTEAQVEFTSGVGPTYPVDPENPGTDQDNEQPVSGSLAIVSVSDFRFGILPVTSKAGLYDITTEQPNIQIVDLRGSDTGWNVVAKVSGFTSDDVASLKGAVIHIQSGRPNSLSGAPAPIQTDNLKLTTDGSPATVISAPAGHGAGLWVMRWYPTAGETTPYIRLEIPAGVATVGKHTATIDWTLGNTP